MAETTVQPNNAKVSFSGATRREMPPYPKPVSKAQNAAMQAAAQGKSTIGIPEKVGKEFAKGASKTNVKQLPQHIKTQAAQLRKRGAISDKAYAKMMKA
jgi:hypothetical protein